MANLAKNYEEVKKHEKVCYGIILDLTVCTISLSQKLLQSNFDVVFINISDYINEVITA